MAYLALYREWRPRTFQEIVGQKHVTRTLMNALEQDKVAHAYLFSGPRGTGKTTTAKILAKALNCEQRIGVEPCNACDSCKGIDQGIAMEVMEIDAASNRGIDEIRDLRENVKLSAARGRFKVYIIDEVHMLTSEAFNALLKTLEEPPQRVIFILATTEAHKIPLTILSRVQRFEFYRVALEDIKSRLTEVVNVLGRQVDQEAIQVIALKSEGGLRDALSILDQCLVQDDPLGVPEVYQVLGMVGETFSSEIMAAFLTADYGKALNTLAQGIEQGRDPRQILRELSDYLRQMLLFLTTGQTMILPHLSEKFRQQSKSCGLDRLLLWIEVLLKGESQLKYAINARLAAELLIVEAMHKSESMLNAAGQVFDLKSETGQNNVSVNSKTSRFNKTGTKGLDNRRVVKEGAGEEINSPHNNGQLIKPVDNSGALGSGITIDSIVNKWSEILENVRQRKKSTHAFLMEGKPERLEAGTLIIVFRKDFSFHRDKVEQTENRQTIQEAIKQLFGVQLSLRGIMEDEQITKAGPATAEELDREALIKRTVDIFGPEIVVIKEES
ncbi:MAG: DNA polymerase III subunit gamma/tau [Desulfitobacteriaceae bacterium]|nr:DNA polymerase III subunit gamma/tau [Desulfitobacteriaceae bacterium]MDD4345369.1 DNA polymerase III subunit gamma/tau [Desulfitobacteriaceae bacterium]MDD4400308.1 DNA polymerase III subunit gamma/tau [Desulfitobacteriaceae bacterium]